MQFGSAVMDAISGAGFAAHYPRRRRRLHPPSTAQARGRGTRGLSFAGCRDVVARLANADARIDVFECCLTLLLAATLDELETGSLHGSASLLQEVSAIHTLFVILASQGTKDEALARRAYESGISVVLPEHRPPFREIASWPLALGDALARLAQLRPIAKKVLIEGLVRCIAHDQKLSVEEGELLRTVCAVLHCPLPPILSPPREPGS
jgi:hypothetical protein